MLDQLALALALPPTQGELIVLAAGNLLVLVALLFPIACLETPMTAKTIPLDAPIARGETSITEVTVRKPGPGELRGLTLKAVGEVEFDTMIKLLPRVTTPALTVAEVSVMDLGDFTALATEVAGFLLSKAQRQDFQPE